MRDAGRAVERENETSEGKAVSEERRRVGTEPLTEEAWAPFGWLPVADTDPHDGEHRLSFEWSDVHVNLIGHARTEVPQTPDGLRCEMLYRHDTHTQTVMSLDVPAIIAVAPAAVTFTEPSDVAAIHVFHLEPLEPLVLHRGTWHWGPFPVADAAVQLFNVQGLRYAEDNACVDLAARGLDVDVVLA
jgi:ureidoglycolate hydrolase